MYYTILIREYAYYDDDGMIGAHGTDCSLVYLGHWGPTGSGPGPPDVPEGAGPPFWPGRLPPAFPHPRSVERGNAPFLARLRGTFLVFGGPRRGGEVGGGPAGKTATRDPHRKQATVDSIPYVLCNTTKFKYTTLVVVTRMYLVGCTNQPQPY